MNRPSLSGNHLAPWSRERNTPPHALGSWASARSGHESVKTRASKPRKRIDTTDAAAASAAGQEVRVTASPRRAPDAMTLRLARFLSRGKGDLGHPGAVQPHPRVLRDWVLLRVRERLVRGDAVLVAA